MENTKAKKVLIVVLIILLLACLGVIVYQYLKLSNTNKEIANSTTTGTTQQGTSITNKTTAEENKQQAPEKTSITKCEETSNKQSYVAIKEIKSDDYSIKVISTCNIVGGTLTFSLDNNGAIEATFNINGEDESVFENGKTYKVTGLTKKAVGVYCGHVGNGIGDSVVAVMEDGTLEQIITRENKLVSQGTLKGVSNVVRLEQASKKLTAGGGLLTIVAVQADENCVILSDLKNWIM